MSTNPGEQPTPQKAIGPIRWTAVRRYVLCLLSSLMLIGHIARAANWPAYRANNARTATTSEKLEFPLMLVWKYVPAQQHQPAWPDPFLIRGRGKNFDAAPQPIIAVGLVYFGSTTDNTLWALDAASGKMKVGLYHRRADPLCAGHRRRPRVSRL